METFGTLGFAALMLLAGQAVAAPDVVVSVKPVHSLVAGVMAGVAQPALIVDGAASPHSFTLKPSNAAALQKADIVFRVGSGLDGFLEAPLAALARKARIVTFAEAEGLVKLPQREGGNFEAHDDHDHAGHSHTHHHHGHDDHGGDGFDTHLWLDPANARAMVTQIAAALIDADAENAARYRANADALSARLDALDRELAAELAVIASKPFIVFHDAYQYFEKRYHLNAAGSITVSPDIAPGADRLRTMRATINRLGAICVFAEPHFDPKLVRIVTEGTAARIGVLDPEATVLQPGEDLYFDLMRGLSRSVRDCLSHPA